MALAPGSVVGGKYRLERVLGEGGMGQVWAAVHQVTGKEVALKLLKSEREEDRKRLVREARAACTVKHPGIAVVHDVTELEDGSPLLVMDLLEGESLRAKLLRSALPLDETAKIISQVAGAVHAAHGRGIVHRDLKPDNVFVCADGTVKVLDFGVAKVITTDHDAEAAGLTASGSMLGTPYYMAPEQAFGEKDVDARADIWALGVMIYECLSGERPTQADNLGQILKIITTRSFRPLGERVEGLPREIDRLVERCMRLEKSDRPQSADEIEKVLEPFTRGDVPRLVVTPRNDEEPSTALASTVRAIPSAPKLVEPESPPPKAARWPFAALAVLAIGGGVWAFTRRPAANRAPPSAPSAAASIAPEPTPEPVKSSTPVPSASAPALPPRIFIRPAATTSASTAPTESSRRTKVVTDAPF